MLSAVVAGAAIFAPLVAAQINQDSIASCSFRGSGLAGSMSEEVAVEVVGIVSEYLCGNASSTPRVARATASEIAEATAFAIASASASCFATGNSTFRLNGRSAAGAEAVAVSSAIVDIAGSVEVCGECSVAAALWARSYEEIIITAAAEAEVALSGSGTPGALEPLEVRAGAFAAQFVEAATEASIDILLQLQGAVNEGCNATILADIGSGLSGLVCDVSAAGSADSSSMTSTRIAAAAGVSVAGGPCGVEVETFANVSISQVAEAMASALAEVSASCLIAGDAYVCALAEAEINATANATAFAFAAAYAEETETCGAEVCNLRFFQLVSVCRTILIRATSALYLEQCAGGDSFFSITAFQETLTEVILAPFIEVIGQITAVQGRCSVTLPIFDVPSDNDIPICAPTCSEDNKVCAGSRFDTPAACCSPDYICVRRDENFSQCRLNGRPGTRRPWDGREEVCRVA